MSTAAVSVQTNTETFDVAYGFQSTTKKDKEGKEVVVKEAVVISSEKAEELEKVNQFEGEMVSVRVNYPATFESIVALTQKEYKDDEGKLRDINEVKAEIVKLFVNGAKGKVMNRLRAQLTKLDENGKIAFKEDDLTDGVLDLTDEITSGSKRVFLTEEQKTWRSLENLPSTVRESMWKVYLQSINKEFYIPAVE